MDFENTKTKIEKFTDLHAWQESHKLILSIYQCTSLFPKDEQYGLVNQMRRCAISITSNIAEGFARHGLKDKVNFYHISLGSLNELYSQLMVARDISYIPQDRYQELEDQLIIAQKLLNGLITSTKNRF